MIAANGSCREDIVLDAPTFMLACKQHVLLLAVCFHGVTTSASTDRCVLLCVSDEYRYTAAFLKVSPRLLEALVFVVTDLKRCPILKRNDGTACPD